MAGFVSLFSFPFFLQKRKGKLLPSAIRVKNYLAVTASSGCLSLSVSLVLKSVHKLRLKHWFPREEVKLDCLAVTLLTYRE